MAGPDHSPGQDATRYCMSTTWENALPESGPIPAACLDTQSKVISGSDILQLSLFCIGGKQFLIIC